ncbi:MAG: hypothetical protein K9W44_17540 [Candidatus Lokiarchaeota archaeon]|nr:hypothetical protein [Candidatus Harpocratesius repetitus]
MDKDLPGAGTELREHFFDESLDELKTDHVLFFLLFYLFPILIPPIIDGKIKGKSQIYFITD